MRRLASNEECSGRGFLTVHYVQIEIVRFNTDNESIGQVLCKRAEVVNAVAVVMASHNKVHAYPLTHLPTHSPIHPFEGVQLSWYAHDQAQHNNSVSIMNACVGKDGIARHSSCTRL